MGRPTLGAAAREVVAACRLTKAEKSILTDRYGNPGNFFRRMVDKEMSEVKETMKGQDSNT